MTDKILVSGASGFVGSALCATLERRGIPVVAAVRRAGVAGQFESGELSAATDWSAGLAGCAVVIHLAARVHVMNDASGDPLAAFRAMNVDVTLNLARQAATAGVRRFVFVSSVKVNGEETSGTPFRADDPPAPLDPYGVSKMEAERALALLSAETGMEVVVVRPPLVYGPGVRANFLRLMRLVKRGVPLPLGAVHNRRSMVALDNLVDFLILCARHPRAAGQVFMVSDDRDVSVTELLRMLATAMDKRSLLVPIPAGMLGFAASALGQAAVARRLIGSLQVDVSPAKALLGWTPPLSVEQAIDQTVSHFLGR